MSFQSALLQAMGGDHCTAYHAVDFVIELAKSDDDLQDELKATLNNLFGALISDVSLKYNSAVVQYYSFKILKACTLLLKNARIWCTQMDRTIYSFTCLKCFLAIQEQK